MRPRSVALMHLVNGMGFSHAAFLQITLVNTVKEVETTLCSKIGYSFQMYWQTVVESLEAKQWTSLVSLCLLV